MKIAIKIVSIILAIIGIVLISQYQKGIEILSYIGMLSGGFTLAVFIWVGLDSFYDWALKEINDYRSLHNGKKK